MVGHSLLSWLTALPPTRKSIGSYSPNFGVRKMLGLSLKTRCRFFFYSPLRRQTGCTGLGNTPTPPLPPTFTLSPPSWSFIIDLLTKLSGMEIALRTFILSDFQIRYWREFEPPAFSFASLTSTHPPFSFYTKVSRPVKSALRNSLPSVRGELWISCVA